MANDIERRPLLTFGSIMVFGAFGAIVAYFIIGDLDISVGNMPYTNATPTAQLIIRAAAGGIAAIVFIFVLANTDRSDTIRLFATALVAGIFWQPVWESARLFVDRAQEAGAVNQIEDKITNAKLILDTAGNGVEMSATLREIDSLLSEVRSPDLLLRVDQDLIDLRQATSGNQTQVFDESLADNISPSNAIRLWGTAVLEPTPPANGGTTFDPGSFRINPSWSLEGLQRVQPTDR